MPGMSGYSNSSRTTLHAMQPRNNAPSRFTGRVLSFQIVNAIRSAAYIDLIPCTHVSLQEVLIFSKVPSSTRTHIAALLTTVTEHSIRTPCHQLPTMCNNKMDLNFLVSPGSARHGHQGSNAGSSPDKGKAYRCGMCGRGFAKKEHRKRHVTIVHEGVRRFMCGTCDLRFGTRQNLNAHLATDKHRMKLSMLERRH